MLRAAISEAERLADRPLLDECLDPSTGELQRLVVVTDKGPAFKSLGFARFIADRVELDHVRTRHYSPETNGVVERFNQSLKYEHLYRLAINDVLELDAACEEYRRFYNDTRPHEALASPCRSPGTSTSRLGHRPRHTYPTPKVSKVLDAGQLAGRPTRWTRAFVFRSPRVASIRSGSVGRI